MDIISTFNPPRLVVLNGRDFWLRGLTIEDFALIVAWLDDILPGYEERILPPRFLSDDAQAKMETPLGWCILAWAGMRHQTGMSWDHVSSLILNTFKPDYPPGPSERSRLISVLFRRRKTLDLSLADSNDLGEAWWGPMVESLCTNLGFTIHEVAAMTLDQIDCLGRKGIEEERPGILSVDQVQAMWEAARTADAI